QSQQGINPRTVEEADVFAIHQEGGYSCVEVFFFRTGQNWGNRAYFPRAEKSFTPQEVLGAFLAQFYDDKPPPKLVLLSHQIEEAALLADALSVRAGYRVEVSVPKRGEKKELIAHALTNAREALGRKLADTATQGRLLDGMAATLRLSHPPKRIEVYDNSHIQGTNAVGAMVVAGPEGFRKNQYRKFNIRSAELAPGDDYGMMREMLTRRFKRLMAEAPRAAGVAELATPAGFAEGEGANPPSDASAQASTHVGAQADARPDEPADEPWPDLVLIDGGEGQLTAARETLASLGVTGLPLVAIAKGPDRDAGRETFHAPGKPSFKLPPRDPVLYFVQRLRDEAHRFAVGSHRARRKRDIREAGLQEIAGIGPTRKRALLRHFGTLKQIERASLSDLSKVPGINAETARRIYDFFHDAAL
ncbi:MAG TPA: excinuclease ABC subunit UvrC, partial [Xanthobacteraceae bacterium]